MIHSCERVEVVVVSFGQRSGLETFSPVGQTYKLLDSPTQPIVPNKKRTNRKRKPLSKTDHQTKIFPNDYIKFVLNLE
jgi:hypothetical protein